MPGLMLRQRISEADRWTRKGGREGAGDPKAVRLEEPRGPCWGSVRAQNILRVPDNLSFTANLPYLQFYIDLYDYLTSAILPQ